MFDTSSILIKKFDGQMFDGMFNNVALLNAPYVEHVIEHLTIELFLSK